MIKDLSGPTGLLGMLPSKSENAPGYILPRDARVPSDLTTLETTGPYNWIGKIERTAQRERSTYITSLIADYLSISD